MSIGLDDGSRTFLTAALKEYPQAFSSALAGAFSDQADLNLRTHQVHTVDPVAPPLLQWLVKVARCSEDVNERGVMRSDCQPRA